MYVKELLFLKHRPANLKEKYTKFTLKSPARYLVFSSICFNERGFLMTYFLKNLDVKFIKHECIISQNVFRLHVCLILLYQQYFYLYHCILMYFLMFFLYIVLRRIVCCGTKLYDKVTNFLKRKLNPLLRTVRSIISLILLSQVWPLMNRSMPTKVSYMYNLFQQLAVYTSYN